MATFGRLVQEDQAYYNQLEKCIDGDDVQKQHARVMDGLKVRVSLWFVFGR